MQKWYIAMAKPRQEHSSTSFLGQAGIEPYYPEVNECFSVKGGVVSVVQTYSQTISLPSSTMSERIE